MGPKKSVLPSRSSAVFLLFFNVVVVIFLINLVNSVRKSKKGCPSSFLSSFLKVFLVLVWFLLANSPKIKGLDRQKKISWMFSGVRLLSFFFFFFAV